MEGTVLEVVAYSDLPSPGRRLKPLPLSSKLCLRIFYSLGRESGDFGGNQRTQDGRNPLVDERGFGKPRDVIEFNTSHCEDQE